MSSIKERLEKILPELRKESFMENKGLGNEIGYYIFDYDPEDEMLVRDHIQFLIDKVNNDTDQTKIIEFDLYNVMLEIIEERWNRSDKSEPKTEPLFSYN